MDKLYYDRENKKFYVIELHTHDAGGNLVVDYEELVDITDEIIGRFVEQFQEYIAKDGRQVLCFDVRMPQLPDTVYKKGNKLEYFGYPSEGRTEPIEEEND